MAPGSQAREIWEVRFFKLEDDDDPVKACPGLAFLAGIDRRVAVKFRNILRSVAQAPPPSWSGGGTWEAMHGDMAGFYEARTESGELLYRLFCFLEREAAGIHSPSIIVIDGLRKRKRTRIRSQDYDRVRQLGDQYRKSSPRRVL